MKRTSAFLVTVLAGSLVPAVLLAQAAKKSPAPKKTASPASNAAMSAAKPAPELSALGYFSGRWGCAGSAPAGPMGPEHATQATASVRIDLGHFWYGFRYEEKKTPKNPTPLSAAGFWGYDVSSKKFIQTGSDSMGGWGTSTSPGWEGDKLTWVGESQMGGQKMSSREIFLKKGPKEFTHTGEGQGSDGKWITMDEETCKRQ
jgi:uncharacterized protein DUF1579